MSHLLPSYYRVSRDLRINLVSPNKRLLLSQLKFGFLGDWSPTNPSPLPRAKNFLFSPRVFLNAGMDFRGWMLGDRGWSLEDVKKLRDLRVFMIPGGAVPKNNDPCGRIINNYGFPSKKSGSINAAH